jgi:hypothetical protein
LCLARASVALFIVSFEEEEEEEEEEDEES